MNDLPQFLKQIMTNDLSAIDKLLLAFKEEKLTQEEQEQVHFYLQHVTHDQHIAIYVRALLYQQGYGVKQDLSMSFLLLREAASKGNSQAIYWVGYYYLEGKGVEVNLPNAYKWLTLAAGSPHYVPQAMFELGKMYREGLGISKDLDKAHEWFEKAAKKGHEEANKYL